jgi:vacuolar iron transporter family protein
MKRGLDKALSLQVAGQLMAHDALGAHARDELGISPSTAARPVQAALASAAAFSVGAALPLVMALMAPDAFVVWAVSIASLLFLAILGAAGAKTGGARMLTATIRVTFWGALAMAVTAGIGALFGTQV